LTDREIIANKLDIFSCAKAFREDANKLMRQLSKTFNFDLNECGRWPAYVSKSKYNNKGILDSEWSFYLHGAHCHFENLVTKQIVEVRFTENPEFGCLDGFFFYTYMKTTDKFKSLANWFDNHSNVYYAIEILSEAGTLTKKKTTVGNYVVAL
jgi:hypothetical protein